MSEKSLRELEFEIFCIENLAVRLQVNPREAYDMLAKKTDLLQTYIGPGYDVLHTQDKDYIVNELTEVLKERGAAI